SGKVAAGSLIPTGYVAIALNGVTQQAPIQGDRSEERRVGTEARTVVPGAPYTITYNYPGDNNFNGVGPDTSQKLVVQKATPVFSNLVGPSITFGAAPTALSGKVAAGSLIPTGYVAIALNGVTQQAPIQGD